MAKHKHVLTNTVKQSLVYDIIKSKPGEDPVWLASLVGTTPSGFGRIAYAIMKMGLVYYYNGQNHKEWYVSSI